jgi:hypothetical protein
VRIIAIELGNGVKWRLSLEDMWFHFLINEVKDFSYCLMRFYVMDYRPDFYLFTKIQTQTEELSETVYV